MLSEIIINASAVILCVMVIQLSLYLAALTYYHVTELMRFEERQRANQRTMPEPQEDTEK